MARSLDGIVDAIAENQTLLRVPTVDLASLVTRVVQPYSDPAQSLNGFVDTGVNGAVYYLLMTLFANPAFLVRPGNDATTLYVTTNRAGKAYTGSAGAAYCVTSDCLANSVIALNTMPVASLGRAWGGGGGGAGRRGLGAAAESGARAR